MFQKTLHDLVKGIRAASASDDLASYVASIFQDIKKELKSNNNATKAIAVSKLNHLKMLGYDTSWCAFGIVEVMSMSKFRHKRIGYLAAAQAFTQQTEVVLLCTNLLKKELQSQNPYAIGLAINCLSNVCTEDLAMELLPDLIIMMSSSRSYVKKKAILVMYKLFVAYPKGLEDAYAPLKKKLADDDDAAVSCAVNVVCELAQSRPQNYLKLAPMLFEILTNSSNNWMLIKVVKLLGRLVSQEPRLALDMGQGF